MQKQIISRQDRIFDAVNGALLLLVLLVTLYPLYFMLIASISNPILVGSGQVFLYPKDIMFDGLKLLVTTRAIWTGYRNTLLYTSVGTMVNLLVTIPAAYTLSRRDFHCRKIILFLFAFTMIFNGGMIPTYIVVQKTGLLDSMWSVIVPTACNIFNLIVAKSFFDSMPYDLTEAAIIDGCTNFRLFISIILPLSKAMLAVITLYYMVGHWNSYFEALIYLSSSSKFPLQLVLREILIQSEMLATSDGASSELMLRMQDTSNLIKYGAVVVSSLPLLILYPFVQKYFVQGVMIGAVKG